MKRVADGATDAPEPWLAVYRVCRLKERCSVWLVVPAVARWHACAAAVIVIVRAAIVQSMSHCGSTNRAAAAVMVVVACVLKMVIAHMSGEGIVN